MFVAWVVLQRQQGLWVVFKTEEASYVGGNSRNKHYKETRKIIEKNRYGRSVTTWILCQTINYKLKALLR
jgi:hypothetical protein